MLDTIENVANFERSILPEEATQMIFERLNAFEKRYHCSFHHYKRRTTDIVYVQDEKGNDITYGLGKGVYSKIGAYGECLEHFLYKEIGKTADTPIALEVLKKSDIIMQDIILRYSLQLGDLPEVVNCIEFERFHDKGKIQIPSLYVNYHYLDGKDRMKPFECFLGRYVTTSGAAFALTEHDAFLHALNETLERDATSEFFLKICGKQDTTKNHFYNLNLADLPEYLTERIHIIQNEYQPLKIEIFISRTVFGVWWSLCIVRFGKDSIFVLPQWGAGCSILYDLAIYRSISECIQMLDNYGNSNYESDTKLQIFVKKYPHFRNAAFLETENKCKLQKYDAKNNSFDMSVRQQIEYIVTAMNKEGFYPSKHISHCDQNFFLVCAYTPNLERFYNITKAMPVLPINYIAEKLSRNQAS